MVKVESQINIDDLTTLLISASRMLAAFAALKPFEGTNIGLAEWVALTILEKNGAVSSKQLSRIMGVTRLRSNQLLGSLSKEELATIREATDDRRSTAEVSPKGQEHLKVVNSELQQFLGKALEGREETLASASRRFHLLIRLIDTVAQRPPAEGTAYAASVARLHR
ncbi:hypothetical protein [Reyranella sp.]|uniref:hypothetical protein n=1 Tax=Reyranella sp. TaxID=1929291 RepID=UPI003BAB808D